MAKETVTQDISVEERLLRIQERQLEIQEQQVGVQRAQLKQTAPKSNAVGPNRSPYNPRGEKDYPMPALKCEIYCPWKESPTYHHLDREEVELYNLLEPGEYTIDLVDGSPCRVVVLGVRNQDTGTLEKMTLCGPKDPDTNVYAGLFTLERKNAFPSIKVMLRQMIGEPAESVLTMKEEVRRIQLPVEDPKYLPISLGE